MLERLHTICSKALVEQVCTGVALAALKNKKNEHTRAITKFFGRTELANYGTPVVRDTLFDLASLTKPLVTALSFGILLDEGRVDLDTPMTAFSHFNHWPSDKRRITIGQLLNHSSGLPAYKPFFCDLLAVEPEQRKAKLIEAILHTPLRKSPGTDHCYSDLGYILLGYLLEKITGQSLDLYFKQRIVTKERIDGIYYKPLHHNPAPKVVATSICPWSHKRIAGVVQDENCRLAGEMTGHAGLFGTAEAVCKLCAMILNSYRGMKDTPITTKTMRRILKIEPGSGWTYGFDTPSVTDSSSGRYCSRNTVGHLGYTGTSFWIDLEKNTIIVLLTNRVYFAGSNKKIHQFRKEVHDTVMEYINCQVSGLDENMEK